MKISMSDPAPKPGQQHFVRSTMTEFGKEIEKASNGRIDVRIFWDAQLGKIEKALNLVRGGQVEAAVPADGALAPYAPDVQILGIPYLFIDRKVAYEVLDGKAGQMLAERMAKTAQLRPLAWFENGGYRNFTANRPLTKVEDMKGLKIRTMTNPVHMQIVKSLGASPTPIAWGDLYTALQTGVVDGEENSLPTFCTAHLEEVQKHIILDGHVYSITGLTVSEKWFQSLPEDLRQVVVTAAEHARTMNRELSIKNEAEALKYLESKGVSVVDIPKEEKARFQSLTQGPVLETIRSKVDADVLEAFLAAAKEAEAKL